MNDRVQPGVLRQTDPTGPDVGIVVDSPHSGRIYPEDFGYGCSFANLRSAEDAYVDELCASAPSAGASLLVADFPRAYVDPNRNEDDLNPALISGQCRRPLQPGPKTLMGIGLIREKLANGDTIYARHLRPEEVERRLNDYFHPYHRALSTLIEKKKQRFGQVWHLNMHSMASHANAVTPDAGGERDYDMVLGDLEGVSCESRLIDLVYATLSDRGYRVRLNDPYKGAAITRRYGRPQDGVHTLQIEMNRALYLDERTTKKTAGFAALESSLSHLFAVLATHAPLSQ